MTAAGPVYPFHCAYCGGRYASDQPDANRCGYCEAKHDQQTRQQAGQCGFGCRVFNNICPDRLVLNGSGFCARHQPDGYEPLADLVFHDILIELRVNGPQTADGLARLDALVGSQPVAHYLDQLMDEGMVFLRGDVWHRVP